MNTTRRLSFHGSMSTAVWSRREAPQDTRQRSLAAGSLIKPTNVRHCLLQKNPIEKKHELGRGEDIRRINPGSKSQFLIRLSHRVPCFRVLSLCSQSTVFSSKGTSSS